jgi:hypothetical protein
LADLATFVKFSQTTRVALIGSLFLLPFRLFSGVGLKSAKTQQTPFIQVEFVRSGFSPADIVRPKRELSILRTVIVADFVLFSFSF